MQKAIAYAQCMRSHGVPHYPDPDSQGQFPEIHLDPGLSKQTATCQHLQPGGPVMSQAQQQHADSQLLKFAQCMRAHGVPDFPDPTVGSSGVGFNTAGIPTTSPQFLSAQRACQSLANGAKS